MFIAIPLSGNFQNFSLNFQKKHPFLPVRWLFGHNLHITLIPPFYEDKEKLKELLREFKPEVSPFNLNFEKITFGPSHEKRLIWFEGKTPPEIIKLKNQLEKYLRNKEIPIEVNTRPFLLHVTLARFRPEDFQKFPVKNLDEHSALQEKIDSFVLMESHLAPQGAEYEIIDKFELE